MTAQSLGWAFEQEIFNRAKTLLLAMANHADHTTGYGWASIETLMKESSCKRAAFYAFVGALRRNGYISTETKKSTRKGRGPVYHFWLLFDRLEAPWIEAKKGEEEAPPEDETQDIEESPNSGLAEIVENSAEKTAPEPPESRNWTERVQTTDSAYNIAEPSLNEPSESEVIARQPVNIDRPKAAIEQGRPKGFDPQQRQQQIERLKAAEDARKPERYPVVEGSRAWKAWTHAGHPPTLVTTVLFEGKSRRGWYFPRLFPLGTGPPSPSQSDLDPLAHELVRK